MRRGMKKKIEKRFVEMVKESSDPANGDRFILRPYRSVRLFHKLLEDEFERKINIRWLYKAKKAYGLAKHFDSPTVATTD